MYGLFLKQDKKNLGEALFRVFKNNKDQVICYIEVLCTLKTGIGHGKMIMTELIRFCNENYVDEIHLVSLDTSFNFYKKLGFQTSKYNPISVLKLK